MRSVRLAALALAACFAPLFAAGQAMTTITATAYHAGSSTVTGTICFTPINAQGNPIPVTVSGGGFYQAGQPFCGSLSAGALTATLSVPNPVTDSAPGHGYKLIVYNSVTHQSSNPLNIYGIGATTWSLDTYVPAFTVATTNAFTFTTGSGSPASSCVAPALDVRVNSGVAMLYVCASGTFVAASGSYTLPAATATSLGGVTLPAGTTSSQLAKVAISGNLSDLAGVPSGFGTVPTYNIVYGDSLENGLNLTTPLSAWPNGVQYLTGVRTLNKGVSGATTNSLDQANTIFNGPHPCSSSGAVLYQIGSNNLISYSATTAYPSGGDPSQAQDFAIDLTAQMAWFAACPNVIPATSFAYTGAWSAGPFGPSMTTSTNGNKAAFTATGSIVMVSTVVPAAVNAGTATWTIDGTTQTTPLLFTGYGSEAVNAGAQQALAVVTGLSNTAHTVVITVSSSSGSVGLVWAAGIPGTANTAWPTLFQGVFPSTNPATSYASQYTNAIITAQTTLAGYGLNVVLVDNSGVASPPTCYIDNVHLNDYCNNLIGNNFAHVFATHFGLPDPGLATNPYIGAPLQNEAGNSGFLTMIVNGQTNETNGAVNNAGTETTIFGLRSGRSLAASISNPAYASYDTFTGAYSCQGVTTGEGNTCNGAESGIRIATGSYNNISGYSSMSNSADVSNTIADGFQSLNNVQVSGDVAVGIGAGYPTTPATGSGPAYAVEGSTRVTMIGNFTGQAVPSSTNLIDATALGESAQIRDSYGVQLGDLLTTHAYVGPYLIETSAAIDQNAASTFAGSCAMSSSTSCTVTLAAVYNSPLCFATQQSGTLTGGAVGCTMSGATATIKAATANSETWAVFTLGNPN